LLTVAKEDYLKKSQSEAEDVLFERIILLAWGISPALRVGALDLVV
jgi:hypothetical protein